MKKALITNPPKQEVVSERVGKLRKAWIDYLINLSPRIKIILIGEETLVKGNLKKIDSNFFKEKAIDLIKTKYDENQLAKIIDWPNEKEIAFILSINSEIQQETETFLVEDTYVFCYEEMLGFAFGLGYFEFHNQKEFGSEFSLRSYSEDALSWVYIAKLIKDKVSRIENLVPNLPG